MSDTIVEEQEPEVAEGHQFLLEGDLDPDAQENIPAEETDEKPPEKDTASAPEAEEEAKSEEAAPEKDTAVEPREIKGIKVGEKVYPDEAALGSAYQTAEQTIGRQGDHIGKLTTRITELEGQVPRSDGADDPEPEYDALDKEVVDKWNYWVFNTNLSGRANGEAKRKNYSIDANLSADRVTPYWKMSFGLNSDYNESSYKTTSDDDVEETYHSYRKSNGFRGLIVKSLSENWSIGGYSSVQSSIYSNNKISDNTGSLQTHNQ